MSLWLIKHHALKTYEEVKVQLHIFLTSALQPITSKHPLEIGWENPSVTT
jgi:hypothetical protein